ncbi:M15 family metallopeptidase [Halobacillus salinus]|uniref:Peptidase M15 n=1 Tax=Halobacillus salinus TaxID=192814 RepID=A0A4Z0H2Q2_9BACI|nr:M15 family metallopeptidase [Halobacillus salinus]TGB04678.1 peptidase M15 [Halobacillus salinus]
MGRVSKDTLIDRSVRNIGEVHPAVKDKVLCIIERAYGEGINVQFSSGFRSSSEQQRLYNQGRATSGSVVTNAKPGQSVHNYGLAVDFFLTTYDGSSATWTVNKEWRRVAAIGKQLGFQWGGDWKTFRDYPHLDLAVGLTWRDLRDGDRPSDERLNKGVAQKGHAGYEVYTMQRQLKKAGYDLALDGIFGPGTDKILKKFQRDQGLEVDGFNGPATQAALQGATKRGDFSAADKEEENKVAENNHQPSKWAEEDWDEAVENGYFDGKRPKENISREESAIVVNRLRHNFLEIIKKNGETIKELKEEIEKQKK